MARLELARQLGILVALSLGAVACSASGSETVVSETIAVPGFEAIEFEPTAAFVIESADRSAAVDSMRVEVFGELRARGLGEFPLTLGSRTEPGAFGTIDGPAYAFRLDLTPQLGSRLRFDSQATPRGVLELSTVLTPTTAYIHAPIFQVVAVDEGVELFGGLEPWMEVVADSWGSVDVAAVNATAVEPPDPFVAIFGLPVGFPPRLVTILSRANEAWESGNSASRGVATRIVSVTVPLGDLIEWSGEDLVRFSTEQHVERYLDGRFHAIQVHIDSAGLVRRIEFEAELRDFPGPAGADGEITVWRRIDFFDLGEPLAVEVPESSIDITDELIAAVAEELED